MNLAVLNALAITSPRTIELKTFGDWIAGCDNARACEARALLPEGTEGDWSVMEVRRGAAANSPVTMAIVGVEAAGQVELVAGDRDAEVHMDKTGLVEVTTAFVPAILAAARTDPALLLRTREQLVSRVSLKDASAAMLWIDDQQKRLGTTTSLSRPELRPAATIPAPPSLPTVVVPSARSTKPPAHLTAAALREVVGDSACKAESHRRDEPPSYYRLDSRHTLALVPLVCISGDYNIEIDAQVISDGSRDDPQPAEYEKMSADDKDGGDIQTRTQSGIRNVAG